MNVRTRQQIIADAESLIMAEIERHFPIIRNQLAELHPLEAYALLGNLMVEMIERFPPGERMQLANAWIKTFRETFREGVRDGLDAQPGAVAALQPAQDFCRRCGGPCKRRPRHTDR
jgi:hypothetical protein